jgi:hypothetical protein
VSRFGDQSIESAPAWLEYGSALLVKEEENPSDDLLAAASAEAKRQAAVLGKELAVRPRVGSCRMLCTVALFDAGFT